jgi:ATP-dependent 26S proteasome regulatory subunit
MDQNSLEALEGALAATPNNSALRLIAIRGWDALGRHDRAAALCEPFERGGALEPPARLDVARVLRVAGRCESALAVLGDADAPELLVERARALVALHRIEEARASYTRALAISSTVEDPALAQLLGSREPNVVRLRPDAPRLRVVSNDDTDVEVAKKLLGPSSKPVTFAEVGGLAELKSEVHRRIVLPFEKPSLFERFRKRVGGGVLLYGPPGCGKTLLARATAGECKAKFFSVAIHDVLDMYMGESERKLHALFELARQQTPAVLFFDEIEALAAKRKSARDGTATKIVSLFLAEMDGFAQNNKGVLLLGATNVPWEIDAAFRRPGRFDRVLFVPPPDREARQAIFEIHLRDRPVADDVDARLLAERTSGFSGADIENVIETAADRAIAESLEKGDERPIRRQHLLDALSIVRATTTEWLSTARNYARYANEGGQYDDVLGFLSKHQKG